MKVCLRCSEIFEDDEIDSGGYHRSIIEHKSLKIHSNCGPTVDMMIMTAVATSLMNVIRHSIIQ
jgi:hypothetical protein